MDPCTYVFENRKLAETLNSLVSLGTLPCLEVRLFELFSRELLQLVHERPMRVLAIVTPKMQRGLRGQVKVHLPSVLVLRAQALNLEKYGERVSVNRKTVKLKYTRKYLKHMQMLPKLYCEQPNSDTE